MSQRPPAAPPTEREVWESWARAFGVEDLDLTDTRGTLQVLVYDKIVEILKETSAPVPTRALYAALPGSKEHVILNAVKDLRKQGRVKRIRRGLYLPIPKEG